jgi:hypothetical protein
MKAFARSRAFRVGSFGEKLRPAYVFVGDEVFPQASVKRFSKHLVPGDLRDFSLFDFDLADTDLTEVLDRARRLR